MYRMQAKELFHKLASPPTPLLLERGETANEINNRYFLFSFPV